jgi:hypothetical protein
LTQEADNETALVVGDLDVTQHAQLHSSTTHFKLSFTKLKRKRVKISQKFAT